MLLKDKSTGGSYIFRSTPTLGERTADNNPFPRKQVHHGICSWFMLTFRIKNEIEIWIVGQINTSLLTYYVV